MKKSVFEIIPDYYYLKRSSTDSVAIIKDPNVASMFDLEKPVDVDHSEFIKEEFPNGHLIPLELAIKKYLEGRINTPSVIHIEAVDYINSLNSPLETLCYTNRRTRIEKMIWVIIFVVQVIYTFLFYLNTLSWVISLIAFVTFPLIFIVILGVINVVEEDSVIAESIVELLFPDKYRKTKDFEAFISILKKYSFSNITDIVLFIFIDESTYINRSVVTYDYNVTYDLFNRVKTFALESFLAADQRGDERALEKILLPMTQDILNEAQDKYEKYLKLENDFESLQNKQLEENIKMDINAYKNRMFRQ